jgi:putative FmdB family regulatory protein
MIMPTYVYKCEKCNGEFEVQQRITEDPLNKCILKNGPQGAVCDGDVHRKISKNISLIFNGKGFYLTDYAKKSSSPATT